MTADAYTRLVLSSTYQVASEVEQAAMRYGFRVGAQVDVEVES